MNRTLSPLALSLLEAINARQSEPAGRHRGTFKPWMPVEYIGRHSAMRAIREATLTWLVTR